MDLSGVMPGTAVTLYFDLLGFGTTTSRVVVDDVFLISGAQNPPTALSLGNTSVAENAAGASVDVLTVTDPDAGDAHTFTVSDARFEVAGGVLHLKASLSLDYEAEPAVTLTITATDPAGLSITRPFTITVLDVNEAPTAPDAGWHPVPENAAAAIVGPLTVTDPDAADTHTFTISDDRFEVAGGQLRLKPGMTLDFEAEPAVTLTITATDAGGLSITRAFPITALDVNEAPTTLTLGSTTVAENAAGAAVGALAVTDPDAGDTHTFTVSDPRFIVASSVLQLAPGNSLDHESGPMVTLTITATDRGGLSVARACTITVLDVNEAPSFHPGADQVVDEDAGPQVVPSWAADIAAGPREAGQTLTFLVTTDNDALFAVLPGIDPMTGTLAYVPAPNASGTAHVTVRLRDDGGIVNGAQDTSDPRSFTILINPVNDAPAYVPGSDQGVDEDAGAQIVPGWATAISAGPADEASQTLNFLVTTDNDSLFAVLPSIDAATGTLIYTPAVDANGVAIVTVTLQDSGGTDGGDMNTAAPRSFQITVLPVNDRPTATASPARLTITEAAPATAITLGASDVETAASALTFVITQAPAHGTLTLGDTILIAGSTFTGSPRDVTYQPDSLFNGPDSFLFQVTDTGDGGSGALVSDVETVAIDVTAVNDTPTAVPDNFATDEDTPLTIAAAGVLGNDGDIEGDVLTAVLVGDVAHGTLTLNADGSFTYLPDADYNGDDRFTYRVVDGDGDESPEAAVTISVAPVNDAPSGAADALIRVNEDTASITIPFADLLRNDSPGPANEGTQALTIIAVADAEGGTVRIDGTGVIFTPTANFSGSARFLYTLRDDGTTAGGDDFKTATATARFTITAVNNAHGLHQGRRPDPPGGRGGDHRLRLGNRHHCRPGGRGGPVAGLPRDDRQRRTVLDAAGARRRHGHAVLHPRGERSRSRDDLGPPAGRRRCDRRRRGHQRRADLHNHNPPGQRPSGGA